MTRSVEIPDEAVAKGAERLWLFRTPIAKTRESCTEQAREVITAALSYLAPAVSFLYDCETCEFAVEDEAKAQEHRDDNPTHAVFEKELTLPAPAGDGGLREALERQAERWEGMDTPGLAAPSHQQWAEGVDCGYGQAAADLRLLLVAHPAAPAVPQPVDREALRKQIESHRMTSSGTAWKDASCKCGWTGLDYWSHQTAMILAVLAGEQEQVDP